MYKCLPPSLQPAKYLLPNHVQCVHLSQEKVTALVNIFMRDPMNPVSWSQLGGNQIDQLILMVPVLQFFAKYIRGILRTFQISGPLTHYFMTNSELQHSFSLRFYLGGSKFATNTVQVHPLNRPYYHMDRRVVFLWLLSNSS